jgi:putative DNA primase/helicase
MEMIRVPLRDRCRGRWQRILPALGIEPRYLNHKNGPCPLCPGGKDRWRFLDTDGVGSWICTHCGNGAGIDLVMKFTGLPFREAAEHIEAALGEVRPRPTRPERTDNHIRVALNSMWRNAAPVRYFDATDQWLRSRGIAFGNFPPDLRSSPHLRYYDATGISSYPAMLAKVTTPTNKPVTIHRTYLTKAGGKAPVSSPRKLFSAMPKGSAVRLSAPAPTLGIAEGIETALAAWILFGVPTWAAICANGLSAFEPPDTVERLVVFADNDTNNIGQMAAAALTSRLPGRVQVETIIPAQRGRDWNDVLLDGGR